MDRDADADLAEAEAAHERVAVAISGGGHRACLFGLGVLLYLTDAGKNRHVSSIASVSGGSIANGVVAQALAYRSANKDELRVVVGGAARQIANRGTVFATRWTWAYILIVVAAFVAAVAGPWLFELSNALRVVLLVVGMLVAAQIASLRGRVCAFAFARTLFSPGGVPTRLSQIDSDIDHVICATDLHAGEHVYFSGSFVCAYRFGLGVPGDLPLHTAVQASAAFPGAFPLSWLPTARHAFKDPVDASAATAKQLALVDGGVYDNMADQWAQGLEARLRRWPSRQHKFKRADELIVANASAGLSWGSVAPLRFPLLGELLALLRDKSVLYDNGNSVRRRELVARFEIAEREGKGLRGTLVHIPQSPFDLPDYFKGESERWPQRARRAKAALSHLGDTDAERARWRQVARENASVPTTLVKLGVDVSAQLLHHAYVLAMINAHVVLDYPLIELPDRESTRELVAEAS